MRIKQRGFTLTAFLVGATVQIGLISGSFYLGLDYGSNKKIAEYETKQDKLDAQLQSLQKANRDLLDKLRDSVRTEIVRTDEVIRDGIRKGGWWNEPVPEDGSSAIWGSN